MHYPSIEAEERPLIELADRLRGSVWGHLVGDAIGVPYEFRPPAAIGAVRWGEYGTHGQPAGTWSDDGGLMLALLDSLLSVGFDPADQARRALAWRDTGAYRPGDLFDIGTTTGAALQRAFRGTAAEACGGDGERDNGNGSLMRILPVALIEREVPDALLIEHAMRASAVTHRHPRSQITCALYSLVLRQVLRSTPPDEALDSATAALIAVLAAPLASYLREVLLYTRRAGSGYVVDTFWSAWEAFSGASSYAQTVARAIRYGNDTDTTASVAGGLAGAFWGLQAIPSPWLAGMRGRTIVEPLLARLT